MLGIFVNNEILCFANDGLARSLAANDCFRSKGVPDSQNLIQSVWSNNHRDNHDNNIIIIVISNRPPESYPAGLAPDLSFARKNKRRSSLKTLFDPTCFGPFKTRWTGEGGGARGRE